MDTLTVVLVTATLFGWSLLSKRLSQADLTGPIVFVALGAALVWAGLIEGSAESEALTLLVEVALVWVLFTDAARLPAQRLRRDLAWYVRLLGIGLPLTVLLGWGLSLWFWPELGLWMALLVAAALAPTDAALGVPVVTNPAVPSRIRQLITVESGLNDGIVTPVVMIAIAGAAATAGLDGHEGAAHPVTQLALGLAVGCVVGSLGAVLLRLARRHGLAAEDLVGIGVLALAVLAYAAALALDANGFVAAFCGGLAFGAVAGPRASEELVFIEQMGDLVSVLVWLAFGALAVPIMLERVDGLMVLYAVLSLTVVRMLPVALALVGTGLSRRTVLFVGWFGPRGLASLVFALLALEALGTVADEALAVVTVTVLMSVLAHGVSAAPLSARYGRAESAGPEAAGPVDVVQLRPAATARRESRERGAERGGTGSGRGTEDGAG